jgi:ABC-type multidrug transport system fused ATPase/permease subunit
MAYVFATAMHTLINIYAYCVPDGRGSFSDSISKARAGHIHEKVGKLPPDVSFCSTLLMEYSLSENFKGCLPITIVFFFIILIIKLFFLLYVRLFGFRLSCVHVTHCQINRGACTKKAPPKYKGLAREVGSELLPLVDNLMAGLIGKFWDTLELWQSFLILVVMCLVSAAFIFMILKRLERASEA